MSQLDKEAVLEAFTAAYKGSHGKAPKIEASNGWYSVDGGKNMRLAQIQEWTEELSKGSKQAADSKAKSSATATKSKPSKAAAKKPAQKSSGAKKKGNNKDTSGDTPAEAWKAYLQSQAGQSRLPRGMK